jgi:hypothetical protein
MMTMIKKNFLLTIIFAGMSGIILSQGNDFGIWAGASGTYRLNRHLEARLSACLRTINKTSKTDQYFAEVGLGYKLNDYLSCEGSYRIINKNEADTAFHLRHKFYFNIKGTLPAGKFIFSGRLMYQKAMKSYIEDGNDLIPSHYIRLKLKTSYSGPASPLKPFLSFEPFVPILNGKGFEIKKSRTSAGVEIRISRHSSLEAAYIYERNKKTDVPQMHIFSVGYDLVF